MAAESVVMVMVSEFYTSMVTWPSIWKQCHCFQVIVSFKSSVLLVTLEPAKKIPRLSSGLSDSPDSHSSLYMSDSSRSSLESAEEKCKYIILGQRVYIIINALSQ